MRIFLLTALLLLGVGLPVTPTSAEPTPETSSSVDSHLHGAWSLVKSEFSGNSMSVPAWDGLMVVSDGHFARSYMHRLPSEQSESSTLPNFMTNSGSYSVKGGDIELRILFSDYSPLRGMVFRDYWALSDNKNTLTLTSDDPGFIEVWKRIR